MVRSGVPAVRARRRRIAPPLEPDARCLARGETWDARKQIPGALRQALQAKRDPHSCKDSLYYCCVLSLGKFRTAMTHGCPGQFPQLQAAKRGGRAGRAGLRQGLRLRGAGRAVQGRPARRGGGGGGRRDVGRGQHDRRAGRPAGAAGRRGRRRRRLVHLAHAHLVVVVVLAGLGQQAPCAQRHCRKAVPQTVTLSIAPLAAAQTARIRLPRPDARGRQSKAAIRADVASGALGR